LTKVQTLWLTAIVRVKHYCIDTWLSSVVDDAAEGTGNVEVDRFRPLFCRQASRKNHRSPFLENKFGQSFGIRLDEEARPASHLLKVEAVRMPLPVVGPRLDEEAVVLAVQ
jgi:hypothetical protein